jgi:hypothetical protein
VCVNAGIEITVGRVECQKKKKKKKKKSFFLFISSFLYIYITKQTNTMDGGGYMDTYSSQATSNAGSVRVSQGLLTVNNKC